MKSIKNIFAALAIASLGMIGCSDATDDNFILLPDSDGSGANRGNATLVIGNGTASAQTKVSYEYNNLTIALAWEYGDVISLFDAQGNYKADFKASLESDGLTTATFTCMDNEFQLIDGESYQICYPATTSIPTQFTIESSTQAASNDVNHLDDNITLMTASPFTYSEDSPEEVTIYAQQSIVSLTLINIPQNVTPKSVTYTRDGVNSVVELASHTAGDSSITMFLPALAGGTAGDEISFAISYDQEGTIDAIEDVTTLSTSLQSAMFYSYAINMNEDLDLEISSPSVDSGSNYITLPVNSILTNVGLYDDYTIEVTNGTHKISSITPIAVDMLNGGTSIQLTLSGKVYSDDDIVVSYKYNGEGNIIEDKSGNKLDDVDGFTTECFSATPTNLVNSLAQSMYDFEDGDASCGNSSTTLNLFNPTEELLPLSGVRSLKYTHNTTILDVSAQLMYYIGSKTIASIAPLTNIEVSTDYIARFDIYIEDMGEMDLYIRYKGYTVGTSDGITGDQSFMANLEGLAPNEWHTVDVVTNITTYTVASDGYLSPKVAVGETVAFTEAPEGSFYFDNLRFYKKSELYRPLSEGGVDLGTLGDKGEL